MNAATARPIEPLPVWSGRSKQRNWLLTGVVISLALHAALCIFFYRTGFQPTAPLGMEKRQPPTFKVKSVESAPKPLDETAASSIAEAAKPNPDQTDVQRPDRSRSISFCRMCTRRPRCRTTPGMSCRINLRWNRRT